jgi:hypothetical protein
MFRQTQLPRHFLDGHDMIEIPIAFPSVMFFHLPGQAFGPIGLPFDPSTGLRAGFPFDFAQGKAQGRRQAVVVSLSDHQGTALANQARL